MCLRDCCYLGGNALVEDDPRAERFAIRNAARPQDTAPPVYSCRGAVAMVDTVDHSDHTGRSIPGCPCY